MIVVFAEVGGASKICDSVENTERADGDDGRDAIEQVLLGLRRNLWKLEKSDDLNVFISRMDVFGGDVVRNELRG